MALLTFLALSSLLTIAKGRRNLKPADLMGRRYPAQLSTQAHSGADSTDHSSENARAKPNSVDVLAQCGKPLKPNSSAWTRRTCHARLGSCDTTGVNVTYHVLNLIGGDRRHPDVAGQAYM